MSTWVSYRVTISSKPEYIQRFRVRTGITGLDFKDEPYRDGEWILGWPTIIQKGPVQFIFQVSEKLTDPPWGVENIIVKWHRCCPELKIEVVSIENPEFRELEPSEYKYDEDGNLIADVREDWTELMVFSTKDGLGWGREREPMHCYLEYKSY